MLILSFCANLRRVGGGHSGLDVVVVDERMLKLEGIFSLVERLR